MLEDGGAPRPAAESKEKQNDFAVTFRQVGLTYQNASDESLTDIDFTVRRGETIGIIGGTGSGKTSLVELIPRFYDATRGEVLIDGVDVRAYPDDILKKKVGIVMQKAVLFHGTIRENIRWGKPDATDAEIWRALDTAQARDVVEGKEGGLDYVIEQGGKNLSGGTAPKTSASRVPSSEIPDIIIFARQRLRARLCHGCAPARRRP